MNARDITAKGVPEPASRMAALPRAWLTDQVVIIPLIFILLAIIPNIIMALQIKPALSDKTDAISWWHSIAPHGATDSDLYIIWFAVNLVVLAIILGVRACLLQPLQRIISHLQIVRLAYSNEIADTGQPLTMRLIARDIGRFTAFAVEHYRNHQEVSAQLEQARRIIAQFTLQQETLVNSSNREIGTQYRSVLAYANYLEEQIVSRNIDPSLRYDFDDVCESSFNLKLIAGALAMLSTPPAPHTTSVPLADLMQQTMLALAPALDRRSMKLTTAEVDMAVAAQGDPQFIAHILWMMLLGMIRYAADESTLRLRCLYNREGTQSLLSIVVSELSPLQLSAAEREDYLMRQLQHLTPHLFAETIRIHGNVQLANLLIERLSGSISILPLTVSSCEICMVLPSAAIRPETP